MHQGKINNFESAVSDVYSQISIQESFPIRSGKVNLLDLTEKFSNSSYSFAYEQDKNNLLWVNLDDQLIFSLFRRTPIKAGNIIGIIEFQTMFFLGKKDKDYLKENDYSYESYRRFSEELFAIYTSLRQGVYGNVIKAMCSRILFFEKSGIKIGENPPSFQIIVKDEAGHNLYYELSTILTFPHGAKRKIKDVFNLADDDQFKLILKYENPTQLDIKNILKNSITE